MVQVSAVCKHSLHLQLGAATNSWVASFVVICHHHAGSSSDSLEAGSEDEGSDQEPDEELAATEDEELAATDDDELGAAADVELAAAAAASSEALQWLAGDTIRL